MSKLENGVRLVDASGREWTVVTSDRTTTLLVAASDDATSYSRMGTAWVRKTMKATTARHKANAPAER